MGNLFSTETQSLSTSEKEIINKPSENSQKPKSEWTNRNITNEYQ